MYTLEAEAHFDAAHFLAGYHGTCENLHGHRWRVVAQISADELQTDGDERGMVCDFAAFKSELARVVREYDHTFIVEEGTLAEATLEALAAEGFTLKVVAWRTTAENFARAIAGELEAAGLPVTQVEVDETPANRAVWRR